VIPAIRLQVEVALSDFRISDIELRRAIATPLLQDLTRRAIRVEAQAKHLASNASPSPPGKGPGVVTGRYRASITWRPGEDPISPYVDIGSSVLYAPYLELGTRFMAPRPSLVPALNAARTT
jgi:hypothetical protein